MTELVEKHKTVPIKTRVIYKNPHAECYRDGQEAEVVEHGEASKFGVVHMIRFIARSSDEADWPVFIDEITPKK